MSKLQRRLAAIMFTDIVGYSAMMQKDELIANRKRKRHKEVFNSLTPQYDGKILQYYGDGTLSIFQSASAAVESAVAIQRALKQEPKVSLRIGIHTGDITLSEDDIFVDGVNIDYRIESLCIPGGIYISGKVYDDIKNHPTIKAQYIGSFDLKNIDSKTEVYAITNVGITIPDLKEDESVFQSSTSSKSSYHTGEKKRKTIAALLAITLGIFGVHRFYLGDRSLGITYLVIGLIGINSTGYIVGITAIISLIDAIMFYTSSEADFDKKYNPNVIASSVSHEDYPKKQPDTLVSKQKSLLKAKFERYKKTAEVHFRKHRYQDAVRILEEANEIKYDDKEVHFLLAQGYSMLENAQKSLIHLDAAIAFGLDLKKAKYNHALAHLRISPAYKEFVKNNYRILSTNPSDMPLANEPEDLLSTTPDLLTQMNKLKELRNRGFLTEEEFIAQKRRLNE